MDRERFEKGLEIRQLVRHVETLRCVVGVSDVSRLSHRDASVAERRAYWVGWIGE